MTQGHAAPLTVFLATSLALAASLLALAFAAWRHRRNRTGVAIRIHVAGSRGKSSTARLIAAALRAGGKRVFAKTTGTLPRLILPDGSEQDWTRRGPASIAEQRSLFARARRERADAVVVECMAIRPELIAASERHLVRATCTVITNARADHQEELSPAPDAMASSLLEAVPRGGVLVISDEIDPEPFRVRAQHLGTAVVVVPTMDAEPDEANRRLAAAVARVHGVDESAQRLGLAVARADPGAFSRHVVAGQGRRIVFVNAFACNDVASFERLRRAHGDAPPGVVLLNARRDRPLRSRAFIAHLAGLEKRPRVFVAGGSWRLLHLARRAGLDAESIAALSAADALRRLAAATREGDAIWGIGNFRGLGAALTTELGSASPC